MNRIFILSPAKTTGKRAQYLFNESATFDLARRLRCEGATLGEVFSFMSGLYFRGKLAYATHFATPAPGLHGCYVITSNAGLVPSHQIISLEQLRKFGEAPIDASDPRYRMPLTRTASAIRDRLADRSQIVLLGSIATGKYLDVLGECFGERLVFPKDFVGRGDMSRGGLLLRCIRDGMELEYVTLGAAESRTGKRPPKLTPATRKAGRTTDR
jgi:hypothetical protein